MQFLLNPGGGGPNIFMGQILPHQREPDISKAPAMNACAQVTIYLNQGGGMTTNPAQTARLSIHPKNGLRHASLSS